MKKIKTNNKLLFILFLIPFIIMFFKNWTMDNDSWFLFNHGRYVLEHGFPYIEPFTIHEGLKFVMQQWLSAIFIYLPYKFFKDIGVFILVIIINLIIMFMLYKLCMLVSDGNKKISIMVTTIIDILLIEYKYITSRPQIFTYLVLIIFVYFIEKYIKTGKKKYLIYLPVLSIIEINLHASTWWMLLIVSFPFLCEMFYKQIIKKEKNKYDVRLFIICLCLVFFAGIINPYGIDAMLYLFNGMNTLISNVVNEMKKPDLFEVSTVIIYMYSFIYTLLIMKHYKKHNELKLNYLIMLFILLMLSMHSYKEQSYFFIFAFYSLPFFLKNISFKKFNNKKLFKIISTIIMIAIVIIFGYKFTTNIQKINNSKSICLNSMNYLKENYDINKIIMYTNYEYGGYFQYHGIKTYIDARAEIFLKQLNKKEDIYKEYLSLRYSGTNINDFVDKYQFTHILSHKTDSLYNLNLDNYRKVYEDDYFKLFEKIN